MEQNSIGASRLWPELRPIRPAQSAPAPVLPGRRLPVTSIKRLTLPDALRPLDQRSFFLVEGAGTLDGVDIEGDEFKAVPIQSGLRAPTSVTRVGSTAWVSEDQMSFFIDRSRRRQSPSLPFQIYAVPLRKGQTQ